MQPVQTQARPVTSRKYGYSGKQRLVINYLKRFPESDFYKAAEDIGFKTTESARRWFNRLLRKRSRLSPSIA